MNRGKKLLVGLCAVAGVIIAVVQAAAALGGGAYNSYPTYRYRLTVEVDTPDGMRSGYSVIQVETRFAGAKTLPSPGHMSHKVHGEAAVVDLPNGQTLFALLRSDTNATWASGVLPGMANIIKPIPEGWRGDYFDESMKRVLVLKGSHELPRWFPNRSPIKIQRRIKQSGYPMLVRFRDLRDPKTVERVDPENLAAAFGTGVALKQIKVEMVNDPLTAGIRNRLSWLGPYPETGLDNDSNVTFEPPLPQILQNGDFSRGFNNE